MQYLSLLGWVVLCQAAGFIGTIFTRPKIPGWYATLTKPALNPPNWVFGPVWTTLYLLMGISVWLVWRTAGDTRVALTVFAIQLVLNVAWSALFFGLNSTTLGLVGIALLWVSIVATMVVFYQHSPWAAYLLVPYLAWVSFASYLNLQLWMLN